jgi:NTP pyrophosphatase (non-canonical NTP hydrolase)
LPGKSGEVIILQSDGVALPYLPAGWIGREVLVATAETGPINRRNRLTQIIAGLQPWQARPLQEVAADDGAGELGRAIVGAAWAGALILYVTDGAPWDDPVVQYVTGVRSGKAEAALDRQQRPGTFKLQVLENAASQCRHVAEVSLDRLMAIMRRLLGDGGCPWDREQTHDSLRPYLIEEAAEVLEAIDRGAPTKLVDELGDVLLQVAFHAALAADSGDFALVDVVRAIETKMLHRHPHVFADWQVSDSNEVLVNWELLKADEAGSDSHPAGAEPWRPLRKVAVQICLSAIDAAFAAAAGNRQSAEDAFDRLMEQSSALRTAIRW